MFGQVADGLAEEAGNREEGQLARGVLVRRCGGVWGSRGDSADGETAQDQGADAVEVRLAAESAREGVAPPTRARVEQTLTLGLCAVVGHVVGGDAFARSFGHEPDEARALFEEALAAMLLTSLRTPTPVTTT